MRSTESVSSLFVLFFIASYLSMPMQQFPDIDRLQD